eukprot:1217686-Amphidinium_carterae.1
MSGRRPLQHAPRSSKNVDRELLAKVVKQNWQELLHAGEMCKADHEIVLSAVRQNGDALKFAAETCRSDYEI